MRVLLGVTGSIAAYKACELVRLLVQDGHEVLPVLTPEAEGFVTPQTFAGLARREPLRELYPHLAQVDLLVVAPLSANTLAKLAHGLADNVLTEAALAFRGPFLVAPAMNVRMWEHPATQANVAALRERGVELVGPESGELAEGESGAGRMAEPAAILERIRELSGKPAPSSAVELAGKRVLVTAGGTREPLDSVRFLGNRSSGRMGIALAEEARRRGADVTLLLANGSRPPPAGIEVVEAPTAADLARETLARADADVVLMAAAVADYTPREPIGGKRPKSKEPWTITLDPTDDILAELGDVAPTGRCSSASRPTRARAASRGRARSSQSKEGTFSSLTTYPGRTSASTPRTTKSSSCRIEASGRVGKRSKPEVAAAILDEVATLLRGD